MSGKIDLEADAASLRKKYLEERDKRLRADGDVQYVAIEGRFADYADDPYAPPGFDRAAISESIDVLIVGGGFSGILTANSLLKAGIENIRIVEKASDFGGTWYWNRYPGCRCDVEAYIYMPLLEQLKDMPPEKYARASVIFEHARKLGRELDLYRRTHFQTAVSEIRWDEARQRWIVTTDRNDVLMARFVCLGSGPLNRPKLPGIPGIETFKGHSFHTSRWDYGYTGGDDTGNLVGLKDKRVAIIGTGATGIQAIPYLAEAAKQLYIVQRTPAAVDERNNRPTDPAWWDSLQPGWWEERSRNFDGFIVGLPQEQDLVADGWTTTFAKFTKAALGSAGTTPQDQASIVQMVDYEKMGAIRARIDRTVKDPAIAAALKPYYNWFCKRPLFHDEYYDVFNRDNVTLIDTDGRGLERITENAVVFGGKSYEVDCIIYASGFEIAAPSNRSGGFELFGRNGISLAQSWAGGMKTLHGMLIRDFPNLCIVAGLKQASTTFNSTYMFGKQGEHFAQIVKYCLQENIATFNVTEKSERYWLEMLKEKSSANMTFLNECTPGYYNDEGKDPSKGLFASLYGEGPFAYLKILEAWRQGDGIAQDLELTTAS